MGGVASRERTLAGLWSWPDDLDLWDPPPQCYLPFLVYYWSSPDNISLHLNLFSPKLGSQAGIRTRNNALSEHCDNHFTTRLNLVASHRVALCFLGYEPNVTLVHLLAINLVRRTGYAPMT